MVVEAVGPVQEIPLATWILRGDKDQYDVYRLKPEHQSAIRGMIVHARAMTGKPYDIQYEFDDEKLYCSELVFKAFRAATTKDLGRIVKLGELKWKGHEDFVREITGGEVPLERTMITPADLARADQLEQVFESLPD
jgi:hypothetical protein